ncbi:hypothetical protein cand_023260 [Cryptosporidium andersoni]|uniref:Uncharacterized protein n=1 Tax=Cryptosporidium andersoni TaxID=117008 RepID=A0A1J4MSD8_9CRYT|nr:hypothetical protein cand_023260 [Cryptosporidium andersoni]
MLLFIQIKLVLLFIIIYSIKFINCSSLCSLDIGLITSGAILSGGTIAVTTGENIYLMMSKRERGSVPQILSSLYFPLNPEDPSYSKGIPSYATINLTGVDGETITMASIMLYFFALTSARNINGQPKPVELQPVFPWGPMYSYQHPIVTTSQIRAWIVRKNSKILQIPLNNVAIYDLFPLAVIRKYIELRNKRKGYSGKNSLNYIQRHYYCPNINTKQLLSDYFQGRCFFGERCKSLTNTRVIYYEPPWKYSSTNTINQNLQEDNSIKPFKSDSNPTSLEYLANIYEYIELQRYELPSDTLNKLSPNLLLSPEGLFGLSVVLYERQLQYQVGAIERSNYKERRIKKWFRSLKQKLFRLFDFNNETISDNNRKKKYMTRASWKQYPDSLWKRSPLKTWVHSVEKCRYCDLVNIKYNSRKWNEMDYVIATVYYYFLRWQGIPQVFGQYVITKDNLNKLSKSSQKLLNETIIQTGYNESDFYISNTSTIQTFTSTQTLSSQLDRYGLPTYGEYNKNRNQFKPQIQQYEFSQEQNSDQSLETDSLSIEQPLFATNSEVTNQLVAYIDRKDHKIKGVMEV